MPDTTSSSPSPSPSPSPDAATSNPLLPHPKTSISKSPAGWSLLLQALLWRFLARIGFFLHSLPKPSPPAPSFFSSYTTAAIHGAKSATLQLAFYIPPDYHREVQRGRRYPVIVNFHGGGFTLGRYSDDARWAATVVRQVSAVVVGVTYRLAPEHPFPTAVEDGVCALLHLSHNAEVFGLDPSSISLSGFSAGGNLAFTIPLRLQTYMRTIAAKQGSLPPPVHIMSIVAWYPNVDNRLTRTQRRASSRKPSKTLPPILTNLFDASYFPVASSAESPYASPAAASDQDLLEALPDNILLFLCEWDMLLQEGKDFAERLEGLGKKVRSEMIMERGHAFDKAPSPFKLDRKVGMHYKQACDWLRVIHEDRV